MPFDGSQGPSIVFRGVPGRPSFPSDEKRALKAFARTLASRVGGGQPFTCLITGDQELQRLNRTFLAHNYPTDVLSFPSSDWSDTLGEIAISADRAEVQATAFGHTRIDEVRILMLHGFLHLAGMDHEQDRGEMARAERRWRVALGLPDTLLDRRLGRSKIPQR